MKATTRLRHLLKQPGLLVAPGCVDAISGLVNKYFGFDAVYVTGSGTGAAMLGYPDLGLVTLTEATAQAGRIADATGIPVICDGEAGFGSYINVIRAVKEFEKAGVAAIHIEDQVTPPNSPSIKRRDILPRERAVGMIKAALDARTDPDFVIIARSDADEISLDELIERCNLYLDAGADLAMPQIWKIDGQSWTSLPSDKVIETHRRVRKEVKGTLLGLGLPGELTSKEIEELGYEIYILPSDSQQAALAAMFEVIGELKNNGTTRGYFDRHSRLDPKIFQAMLRTSEWLELEEKHTP